MVSKLRKNCIVCKEEIFRRNSHASYRERRSKNSVTCSKRCSKIFTRISSYIRSKPQNK